MALIKKTTNCMQVYLAIDEKLPMKCVWDDNIDLPREICLNDICWYEKGTEWGFITRHKGQFYFESFNNLIPLRDFEMAKFEGKITLKGLMVETDYSETERFIRQIFTGKDLGITVNY